MYIIETNNLTKIYGKSRGIENVNLKIKEGKIIDTIEANPILHVDSDFAI